MSFLACKSVSKTFGGICAVADGTMEIEQGSFSCLIGPNGAGKTTFFNLISGVLVSDAGKIAFRGERIDTLSAYQRARRGISRTFQDPRMFYEMTVRNHVLAGIPQRSDTPLAALLGGRKTHLDKIEARERADRILDQMGLLHRAEEQADRLSFGEQRFLSIARALALDPDLLMLDEPTVGMDEEGIRKLEQILESLRRNSGVTILMVEHNMSCVFRMAERIHLMLQGEVVGSGTTSEMRRDKRLIEAYLGRRYASQS